MRRTLPAACSTSIHDLKLPSNVLDFERMFRAFWLSEGKGNSLKRPARFLSGFAFWDFGEPFWRDFEGFLGVSFRPPADRQHSTNDLNANRAAEARAAGRTRGTLLGAALHTDLSAYTNTSALPRTQEGARQVDVERECE